MSDQSQLAADLYEAHSRLLALLATDEDSEPENSIENLLHDHPIFLRLSRTDLLLTTGIIALTLSDQEETLNLLPELPEELDAAINTMSVEQMQIMLSWMASEIQSRPIPCDLCSAPADPSGFCPDCDRLLNTPAALQVCGSWDQDDDDRDPEHISGISNY